MPHPPSPATSESNRPAVRLLFAGIFLTACGAVLLRTAIGEPYPGPFMPAFKGTGLTMVSPTTAATIVPKFIAVFSDQTTAVIPQDDLFADVPSRSVHRVIVFGLIPNPDTPPPTGHRVGYGKWLTALFPGHYATPEPASTTIQADTRDYLRHRVEKLFPGNTPVSLTISLFRDTFPVVDFHQGALQPAGQVTITFHEGI